MSHFCGISVLCDTYLEVRLYLTLRLGIFVTIASNINWIDWEKDFPISFYLSITSASDLDMIGIKLI